MARRQNYRRIGKPKKTTLRGSGPSIPQSEWGQPVYPPGPAQALPIDSIHTGQTGLIQRDRQNILAQYGNPFDTSGDFTQRYGFQGGQLASEYGFLPGSQNIDPNNPYSRASLLQRSYQQGQRGTTNSMASRGQLYAGATQRGLDEGTFTYSRNKDALSKAYTGSLNDLTQRATSSLSELDQRGLDADSDRIDRASEQDPVPGNSGPSAQDWANLGKVIAKKPKPKPKPKNWVQVAPRNRRTRIG